MITNEQRTQCRNILLSRQSELIDQVKNHYALIKEAREAVGELSSYDNHPGDFGTELFEREKDHALNNRAEKELEDINEALHAIEEGTYGLCMNCGESIPFERLLIVPTTKNCVHHGDDRILVGNRPEDEAVFQPEINMSETTGSDEGQIYYDAVEAWEEVRQYGTSDTPSDQDYHDGKYPNLDKFLGSVEEVEDSLIADLYGNYQEESQKYHL